jgi:hypothetical protein
LWLPDLVLGCGRFRLHFFLLLINSLVEKAVFVLWRGVLLIVENWRTVLVSLVEVGRRLFLGI